MIGLKRLAGLMSGLGKRMILLVDSFKDKLKAHLQKATTDLNALDRLALKNAIDQMFGEWQSTLPVRDLRSDHDVVFWHGSLISAAKSVGAAFYRLNDYESALFFYRKAEGFFPGDCHPIEVAFRKSLTECICLSEQKLRESQNQAPSQLKTGFQWNASFVDDELALFSVEFGDNDDITFQSMDHQGLVNRIVTSTQGDLLRFEREYQAGSKYLKGDIKNGFKSVVLVREAGDSGLSKLVWNFDNRRLEVPLPECLDADNVTGINMNTLYPNIMSSFFIYEDDTEHFVDIDGNVMTEGEAYHAKPLRQLADSMGCELQKQDPDICKVTSDDGSEIRFYRFQAKKHDKDVVFWMNAEEECFFQIDVPVLDSVDDGGRSLLCSEGSDPDRGSFLKACMLNSQETLVSISVSVEGADLNQLAQDAANGELCLSGGVERVLTRVPKHDTPLHSSSGAAAASDEKKEDAIRLLSGDITFEDKTYENVNLVRKGSHISFSDVTIPCDRDIEVSLDIRSFPNTYVVKTLKGSPFSWSDCERYEGGLRNGQFHGQGTLTMKNGKRYPGQWEAGVLQPKKSAAVSKKKGGKKVKK